MLLLLAPAAVLKPQSPASGQPTRGEVCRYGSWARPGWLEVPVSSFSATLFHTAAPRRQTAAHSARQPVGYAVGVAGFLAAKFKQRSAQPVQWPPRLRAIRLDGTTVKGPNPAGDFWYAYPRAATDDAGTLHVVWAEPDEKLPRDPYSLHGELPVFRSVWYATLRAGKWSRAQRIYQGEELRWDELTTSRLIVDDQGTLHIAFAAEGSLGSAFVYLSAIRAPVRRWRSTSVRHREGMGYLDLAIGPDRRVAVVLVAGVAFPRPRPDVLSLTQSRDGGGTWTPVAEVSTPNEEPAIEPHLFFDRNAALRLAWVQQPTGTFVGGKLWHTTLAGEERGAASALALSSNVITSGSRAAIDSCGTIHVMTQAYAHGTPELQYARFTTEGWSTWSEPFEMAGAHASLAASGGVVHVVWDSSSTSSDGVPLSGLAHSTLPILGRDNDPGRRH
jgi:hypothetical protein